MPADRTTEDVGRLMECCNCGQLFDHRDDTQSVYHEDACRRVASQYPELAADLALRLRAPEESREPDGWATLSAEKSLRLYGEAAFYRVPQTGVTNRPVYIGGTPPAPSEPACVYCGAVQSAAPALCQGRETTEATHAFRPAPSEESNGAVGEEEPTEIERLWSTVDFLTERTAEIEADLMARGRYVPAPDDGPSGTDLDAFVDWLEDREPLDDHPLAILEWCWNRWSEPRPPSGPPSTLQADQGETEALREALDHLREAQTIGPEKCPDPVEAIAVVQDLVQVAIDRLAARTDTGTDDE